jgi:hypothetical protein
MVIFSRMLMIAKPPVVPVEGAGRAVARPPLRRRGGSPQFAPGTRTMFRGEARQRFCNVCLTFQGGQVHDLTPVPRCGQVTIVWRIW